MELIFAIMLLILLIPKNKGQQNSNVDGSLKFKIFNDLNKRNKK